MNRKWIAILCIYIACVSFKEPKHSKLSNRIFIPYNKELKKEKHLYLSGSGGAMIGDIQKINASYVSFEKLTIEEARRLYVDVAEGYICRYNQNEQIRPYLHNYPFTIANFEIMIGFENEKRQIIEEGFVALIFHDRKNILVYYTYDPSTDKFIDLYEEPYEIAREIVMKEKAL